MKPCPFCGRKESARKHEQGAIRHTKGCLFSVLGIFEAESPQRVDPALWNVRRKPKP